MNREIIVGLDIGTTKIACFVGQRQENGKVKILGYGKNDSLGVEQGVVRNIKLAAESIRKAVKQAQDMAEYDISEVYVGVAGQHIKSLSSQGAIMVPPSHPYILEEDVENLTRQQHGISLLPGEEIIHLFPQTYYVDGEELTSCEPVGVRGNKLECVFHMVTGNSTNLECIKHAVVSAGLKVKGLVLEPIASSMACLDDCDLDAGVALVDIGGGTTDIAVFKEGIIRRTSVLPLAGNVITNDIKEGCNVMRNHAEKLKTRFGSCMPSQVSEDEYVSIPIYRSAPEREIGLRHLANIIKARTETILEQIDYEVQQSGYSRQLIAGLVLTGGGAQLKHIREFASFITGIDTRIGLPNEHLDASTPKELLHPMYSTGIGLVLYGIKQSELSQAPDTGTDDQLADFPDAPEPEPGPETPGLPEPPETPEQTEKRKKTLKETLNNALGKWLDRYTSDPADNDPIDNE